MQKKSKDPYVGKKAYMRVARGFYTEVIVLSYIPSFGRDRFLVKPVSGSGTMKVEKLSFSKPEIK